MASLLVLYYSRTGNTRKMAEAVVEGAEKSGARVRMESVEGCDPEIMLDYDGIIVGSPTYYGIVAGPVKDFFDESVKFHGQLEGRVGGAFASAGGFGGGSEVTVISLLQILLVHGFIVKGFHKGGHFGPVADGEPDAEQKKECRRLGQEVAELARKLG